MGMSRMSLYYTIIETQIGWIGLLADDGALIEVELPRPTKAKVEAAMPAEAVLVPNRFSNLAEQLELYFSGQPVSFADVHVKFEGLGKFEERVLRETMNVPFGKLTTYGALAASVGSPGAARAVGNTMRRNPLPIIVPCHRVIHSGGGIGGYSAGIDLKRRLLALEGIVL